MIKSSVGHLFLYCSPWKAQWPYAVIFMGSSMILQSFFGLVERYILNFLSVLIFYILILLGRKDLTSVESYVYQGSSMFCSVQIQITCLWEIMSIEDTILLRQWRWVNFLYYRFSLWKLIRQFSWQSLITQYFLLLPSESELDLMWGEIVLKN